MAEGIQRAGEWELLECKLLIINKLLLDNL